jgi:hypothetical protein
MRFFRLLTLALLIMPAAACKHSPAIPQELVGTWVTQDARYQGKSLMIDPEGFVVLVVDEDTAPRAEHVDRLTSTREAGVATYVFEASDQAGLHNKITVMYRDVNGGELRLAHPNQVVWQRATPDQTSDQTPAQ